MLQHSLPALLAQGLCVTFNSDDPAYFGGYLGNNLRAVQAAFDFDAATWQRLIANSFCASFISEAERADWLARVEAHFAG